MVGYLIIFIAISALSAYFGALYFRSSFSKLAKVLSVLIPLIIICAMFFGMNWYFKNTASGQRAILDYKSNLNNGLERTITVYTADGKIIAEYNGIIDIETNDGGYVKFDFEGKRYIYYNCFIESIANIE